MGTESKRLLDEMKAAVRTMNMAKYTRARKAIEPMLEGV